jgi:hypothetical protein
LTMAETYLFRVGLLGKWPRRGTSHLCEWSEVIPNIVVVIV